MFGDGRVWGWVCLVLAAKGRGRGEVDGQTKVDLVRLLKGLCVYLLFGGLGQGVRDWVRVICWIG